MVKLTTEGHQGKSLKEYGGGKVVGGWIHLSGQPRDLLGTFERYTDP